MMTPDEACKELEEARKCSQCKQDMGYEWILGPVCLKCCKANHRKVVGR